MDRYKDSVNEMILMNRVYATIITLGNKKKFWIEKLTIIVGSKKINYLLGNDLWWPNDSY